MTAVRSLLPSKSTRYFDFLSPTNFKTALCLRLKQVWFWNVRSSPFVTILTSEAYVVEHAVKQFKDGIEKQPPISASSIIAFPVSIKTSLLVNVLVSALDHWTLVLWYYNIDTERRWTRYERGWARERERERKREKKKGERKKKKEER